MLSRLEENVLRGWLHHRLRGSRGPTPRSSLSKVLLRYGNRSKLVVDRLHVLVHNDILNQMSTWLRCHNLLNILWLPRGTWIKPLLWHLSHLHELRPLRCRDGSCRCRSPGRSGLHLSSDIGLQLLGVVIDRSIRRSLGSRHLQSLVVNLKTVHCVHSDLGIFHSAELDESVPFWVLGYPIQDDSSGFEISKLFKQLTQFGVGYWSGNVIDNEVPRIFSSTTAQSQADDSDWSRCGSSTWKRRETDRVDRRHD